MTDLRAIRWAKGFALLIQPWPPADKYPKPSRIVMARRHGQLELFTIEEIETGGVSIAIAFDGRLLAGPIRATRGGGAGGVAGTIAVQLGAIRIGGR
jgi:hypothetical protein